MSIFPVDITQSQINTWAGTYFDPSKLDLFGLEKNIMPDAVVKEFQDINEISISNLVGNADSLLSRQEVQVPIEWVGENKMHVPPHKFKVKFNFKFIVTYLTRFGV